MKNRKLLLIVSLMLAMVMSLGGTLAYLTDSDGDINVMTVGRVEIKQNEQKRDGNAFEDQMLLPIVGSAGNKDAAGYPDAANYIDKIVTVTNTGNTDAWVRTLIAFPNVTYQPGHSSADASTEIIHWNGYSQGDKAPNYPVAELIPGKDGTYTNNWSWGKQDGPVWPGNTDKWNWVENVMIDGKPYLVYIATNLEEVASKETTAPNLTGLYLDKGVDFDNDKGYYTYDNKPIAYTNHTEAAPNYLTVGDVKVYVLSQAVQASGFDTAWAAFDAAFPLTGINGDKTEQEVVGEWFATMTKDTVGENNVPPEVEVSNPGTDDEFKDDATADEENIVINLTGDVTYDVAAWNNNVMGGESTKTITINGNNHKIIFNNTNSDWNNVVTGNAVLIIKNATVNNAGHDATSGTWNAHDINFGGKVKFENVVFENAISLKNDATLKNVTITDDSTGDAYGIWIQPYGQTITIDGLTMDMTTSTGNDRGIKIDDQYMGNAITDPNASKPNSEKVTLIVKNATFKTEKKAAILVKSKAGADITLSNVDISGVVADSTNPVWVDAGATDYAEQVTVTGGTKINEP